MKRKAKQCPIVTYGVRCRNLTLWDRCNKHRHRTPNTKLQPEAQLMYDWQGLGALSVQTRQGKGVDTGDC